MKNAMELQLRKIALVLTVILVLQLVWSAGRVLFMAAPESIRPTSSSLQVEGIAYPAELEEALSADLVSRPLFWEGRKVFVAPQGGPQVAPAPSAGGSNAIDAVKLLGLYSAGSHSGIIVSYQGEQRRLDLNESIDDWEFTMYSADSVVFESGTASRKLKLEHAVTSAGMPKKKGRGARLPDAAEGAEGSGSKEAKNKQKKILEKKGQ